jgi:nucleoside-diphosphate-sugar epimerase
MTRTAAARDARSWSSRPGAGPSSPGEDLLLASVRAGNVIGGGDWAADRLIPDLVRAFEAGRSPLIRSPDAVRPWQHVLEALGGYLLIAERLLAGRRELRGRLEFRALR